MSMMKAVKSSISYSKWNRPSNVIPLAAWAIKLMKASQWHIEMNDKDGGFSFFERELVPIIDEEILSKNMYGEILYSEINIERIDK